MSLVVFAVALTAAAQEVVAPVGLGIKLLSGSIVAPPVLNGASSRIPLQTPPVLTIVPAAAVALTGAYAPVLKPAPALQILHEAAAAEGAPHGAGSSSLSFDGGSVLPGSSLSEINRSAVKIAAHLAPSRPAWSQGVFLPKTLEKPLAHDALGVTVHRLPNGLTIYLSPNRQEPRVSFEIAVRAGSRHDPPEATGMAHYLEHMQFKGTSRLGTIDYAKEKLHLDRIEALYDRLFVTVDAAERAQIYAEIDKESQAAAAYAVPNEYDKFAAAEGFTEINAHTYFEETVYKGSFPSNKADAWARVEADRLSDPVYRIFLPELEAVYEEHNKSLDNPNKALSDAAFQELYRGHPYSRSIGGYGAHLKNPSISRMRKFFRDYYRPNNMAIVLSGDFDRAEMLARLENNFGKLAPAAIPAPPAGALEALSGVRRRDIQFQAEEVLLVDWRLPGAKDAAEDALLLGGQLINNLLNLRLKQPQKVKDADSYQQFLNEAGGWLLVAAPKDAQTLEQAEKILMDEVARFKAGDFTDDDLKTAVTQLEVELKGKLENNGDRAGLISKAFIDGREWEDAAGRIERLKRLTKVDVLRAVGLWLGEDRSVIYRRKGTPVIDKVPKPVFTKVPIDTTKQSAFFKEVTSIPTKPLEPHFLKPGRDFTALNRAWGRLIATLNPVNDLFTLEFHFDRGVLSEKKLDLALSLLGLSGSGNLTAEQLERRLDKLGSKMIAVCGEQECVVRLTGLEKNMKETLSLTLDRFARPNIEPGTFATMVEVEKGDRANRKLDADVVFQALGELASRGKNSPFLQALSAAELDALNEGELRGVLRSMFDYKRTVLYSGTRKTKEVADILSAAQKREVFLAPPPARPLALIAPARPRVVFVHHESMAQALIGAYAPDGSYDAHARLDGRIYETVMAGGMGGIYFQEIRESRALAYSAGGGYRSAVRPGSDNRVWSYAGTQADKAVDTATMLRDLMSKPPITAERFAVALSQTEQFYRTQIPQLLALAQQVLDWERKGFPSDPRAAEFARLSSYRREMLDVFLARFSQTPLTFYVVGDRTRVDVEKLKQFGDFEERKVGELFPY